MTPRRKPAGKPTVKKKAAKANIKGGPRISRPTFGKVTSVTH